MKQLSPEDYPRLESTGRAGGSLVGFAGWTPPPGRAALILDPFCGTGTTALVAQALGRDALGVDLSADYVRLAKWRCSQPSQAAKAKARTWDEAQGSLAL